MKLRPKISKVKFSDMTTNLIMHMIRVKVLYPHGLILCFMCSSVIMEKGEVFVIDRFILLGELAPAFISNNFSFFWWRKQKKLKNVKNKCSLGFSNCPIKDLNNF
jgi:hypothetical protein